MKNFSKKKFLIGFLVSSIAGMFYIGRISPSAVLMAAIFGIVVGFVYGKFGYLIF